MILDKRLIKYIEVKKSAFILTIVSGTLAGILTIAQAVALSDTINEVFLNHKTLKEVSILIIYFTLFSILKAVFIWLEQNFANSVTSLIKQKIHSKLFDKYINAGPIKLKSERSGELTNTLINGVESLDAYFSQYLPQLFLSAIIPLIILITVFPIDLISGIVFFASAPLIPLFMWLIGSAAESVNRKQWKSLSRMSAYFLDVIQGITTIKLFNRGKIEVKKIFEISENFRKTTMGVLKIAFLSALVLEIISTISIALVAVEIGLRLLNGNMVFKEALFILIIAPEFYLPIRQLGTRFHAGLEGISAYQRINEILELKEYNKAIGTINLTRNKSLPIIFKNCSFSYPHRNSEAISNINFEIEPNKKTAIVGYSGSGKTTISNLLLRFINPDSGEILFGDKNINEFTIESWREQIALSPQNPYLFHNSIRENITLAKPIATDTEIIEACKKANAHNFITKLQLGYDTILGENGSTISGGQAQRISLARAFLKDAPIVLLDEPTANLDPIIEDLIFESIDALLKNKTALIIAHRLNTIINSDKIVVLSNGKNIEQGTHNELLKTNGVYKQLFTEFNRKYA